MRAGLTQIQLSPVTGIEHASISRKENGKQRIRLNQLQGIARALEHTPGSLVDEAGRR
ncbi:MAG: helix-turn-helix domain-containing protein [Gammaproteobacteria bacterium]|nr:MAG: helix-turn-helix domain-containing protein [Gammaproteobacteria bacterium]